MAEQQMGAKSKGVSSEDINNLSDSDYQKLLDEALNIKSISPHNKSKMMQTLLKEVAIDDDDFSSNVLKMMDAMKESNGAAPTKKIRSNDRRRAKDDQQRVQNNSVASRSIQGGSLQNLTGCDVRKSDTYASGEGKGRGRLQKSGSVNSFISATDDKLFSNSKLKTRSRSHTLSGDFSDSEVTKKCSYGSSSLDGSSSRTRCCPKQTRRKSTCGETLTDDSGEPVEIVRKNMAPGEEIEMMEIDHSDDDVNEGCPLLLKSSTCGKRECKVMEDQVDDSICLPLQIDAGSRDCVEESLKLDLNKDVLCFEQDAHKDGIYENGTKMSTLVQQNKKKKNGKTTELVICNEISSDKVNIVTPTQLDLNGNPLNDQQRNLIRRNFPNLESNCDLFESSSEVEKRRKHKRMKQSTVKAGDLAGNRGDEPVESLLEFINSTDKKTIAIKEPETSVVVKLKNNKVAQSMKTKKQEKENNKKNMPSRIHPNDDDTTRNDFCENQVNGSIFDLIQIETIVDKNVRNIATMDDLQSPIDLSEHVNGTVKIQTVRKAHSWEGTTLPKKSINVNCEIMEVSSDGGVVFLPQGGNNTCEPAVISSFVSDFYEDADVTQLVEEPEFRIVLPKRHRRNNRYISRGEGILSSKHENRANRDFESYSGGVNGERNFSEDMMLLARLPISHRSQRAVCDSRRKSTCSMPPSDHSSVDNSDLDSVHSLPVKSTTAKPAIAKTSSSSSSTPQASYADIAKMATSSTSSSSSNLVQNLVQKQQVGEIIDMIMKPVTLPQRSQMQFLRPINKKDASTCTTDDIPVTRKPQSTQITHWASYPRLAEATGKNDAPPTGNVLTDKGGNNGDSGCPSDESKNDSNTTKSSSTFSSPESVDGSNVTSSDQKLPCYDSGENLPPSCSLVNAVGDMKKEKERSNADEEEEEKRTPSPTNKPLTVAVTMPAKPGTKKRKEAVCSPATTNSSSSEASDAAKSGTMKSNRKPVARNMPAVVIMNKYKAGAYTPDVSFGFEVNEQLMQKFSTENPSVVVVVDEVKNQDVNLQQGLANVSPAIDAVVEMSSQSSCSSDSMSKVSRGSSDDTSFNYIHVVDYVNQSWDSIFKEYEKEKFGAGIRRVKYLSDK